MISQRTPMLSGRFRALTQQPAAATGARNQRHQQPGSIGMGSKAEQQQRRLPWASAKSGGGGSGEGARLAEELVGEAEEQVERLERKSGLAKQVDAHLGPAPRGEADGEVADTWYFAYGSNINRQVFQGRRRINPAESLPAVLPGWRLEFSQPGLPYSEPAFAAVERQPEAAAVAAGSYGNDSGSGSSTNVSRSGGHVRPDVHGVLHRITDSQWRYVLETEGASGKDTDSGYLVVEATAVTYDGREMPGVLTLTVPPRLKERLQGCDALPSLRYLSLIREGAAEYGLAPEYQAWLQTLQHYQVQHPGQKVGAALFGAIAFTGIFPVWAVGRVLRRFTGMERASNDTISRFLGSYTAAMFRLVHGLHGVVRPILGCGLTLDPGSGSSDASKKQ